MRDLGTVDRLLEAPPGYSSWQLAEVASRRRLLATWLSAAAARGVRLTQPELSYLARIRRRVEELHRVGDELATRHGLRVIKGSRIAAAMPAGLLRHSGDADLVAPDEQSLWRCVRDLRERYRAVPQCISVMCAPGSRHVGVAMKWPAEAPHLDKPMGADVTTCAFAGDFTGVPIRVQAPAADDLAGLFAVAEERFQRRFRAKDLLDLLVLADALEARLGDRLPDTIWEHAAELALAPELRQLIAKTDQRVPLSAAWRDILAGLPPLVRQERARRRAGRPGMHELRFGLPLDDRPGGEDGLVVHRRASGDIATTPVGSCLLLTRPDLSEETLAQAIADARAICCEREGR